MINESSQWKQLEEHSGVLKQPSYHLRSLLQNPERSDALIAEHNGIVLDFSRQNLVPETLVTRLSNYRAMNIYLSPCLSYARICCAT